MSERLGSDSPLSHVETVVAAFPSRSPSFSCDNFFSVRKNRSRGPKSCNISEDLACDIRFNRRTFLHRLQFLPSCRVNRQFRNEARERHHPGEVHQPRFIAHALGEKQSAFRSDGARSGERETEWAALARDPQADREAPFSMTASHRIARYVLKKSEGEPPAVRASLCRDLAELTADESRAGLLLKMADTCDALDRQSRQLSLDLGAPAPGDGPTAN